MQNVILASSFSKSHQSAAAIDLRTFHSDARAYDVGVIVFPEFTYTHTHTYLLALGIVFFTPLAVKHKN